MSKLTTLDELAIKHGTDKGPNGHMYTSKYSTYLESFRDVEFNFLEIGIFNGSSIKMWKEYFPKANIIAIDINPDCKKYEEDRVTVHIGDQTDVNFLKSVFEKHEHLDVILDDGGHSWNQQIVSFETLFPLLTLGGFYFIEDMHTSYRSNSVWSDRNITGMQYFKNLTDSVNLHGKSFCGYDEIGDQYLDYYEKHLDYIHFYKSLIAISKRTTSL